MGKSMTTVRAPLFRSTYRACVHLGPFQELVKILSMLVCCLFVVYIIYWQRAGENPSINVGDLHQQLQ